MTGPHHISPHHADGAADSASVCVSRSSSAASASAAAATLIAAAAAASASAAAAASAMAAVAAVNAAATASSSRRASSRLAARWSIRGGAAATASSSSYANEGPEDSQRVERHGTPRVLLNHPRWRRAPREPQAGRGGARRDPAAAARFVARLT